MGSARLARLKVPTARTRPTLSFGKGQHLGQAGNFFGSVIMAEDVTKKIARPVKT
jgi:hypothetical protein